ncbi:MAG: hypothetical protein WBA87_18440 [Microbacterium sp.]
MQQSIFARYPLASEQRSRTARARAEEALVRFALLADTHARDFIVIGGLNPDFLAPGAPHPHLGTTDVDLLFELGVFYDRDELDFGWLERALDAGGFVANATGWQWTGVLGDAHVRLDLVCDVYDSPGLPVELPGTARAAAQNMRGPAAALNDPIERELQVPDTVRAEFPEAPSQVSLRFASLGGYLMAKSTAFMSRGLRKDGYDLAFVMMYAPGGPRAAAAAVSTVSSSAHHDPAMPNVRAAVERLATPQSKWVDDVIDELLRAGDDEEGDQLRSDVVVSAQQFLNALAP